MKTTHTTETTTAIQKGSMKLLTAQVKLLKQEIDFKSIPDAKGDVELMGTRLRANVKCALLGIACLTLCQTADELESAAKASQTGGTKIPNRFGFSKKHVTLGLSLATKFAAEEDFSQKDLKNAVSLASSYRKQLYELCRAESIEELIELSQKAAEKTMKAKLAAKKAAKKNQETQPLAALPTGKKSYTFAELMNLPKTAKEEKTVSSSKKVEQPAKAQNKPGRKAKAAPVLVKQEETTETSETEATIPVEQILPTRRGAAKSLLHPSNLQSNYATGVCSPLSTQSLSVCV